VPSNTRIDNGHAGILQRLRQCLNLLPRTPILYQIQHAQSENDDEIFPASLPRLVDNLYRQSHSIAKVATAVFIIAMIRFGHQELIDEIALGAHDLDSVVSRLLGQNGAIGKVSNGGFDIRRAQFFRPKGSNGAFGAAGRYREGMVRVSTGVKYLQADPAGFGAVDAGGRVGGYANGVDHLGDDLVTIAFRFGGELVGEGSYPSLPVWRDSSGHCKARKKYSIIVSHTIK